MLSALFQIVNSFRGGSGSAEFLRRIVMLELGAAMQRIPLGLLLAIPLYLLHVWLAKRLDTMIDEAHSARVELLHYLALHRC